MSTDSITFKSCVFDQFIVLLATLIVNKALSLTMMHMLGISNYHVWTEDVILCSFEERRHSPDFVFFASYSRSYRTSINHIRDSTVAVLSRHNLIISDPTFTLSGTVYDNAGNGISANVHAPKRESSLHKAGTHVISAANGAYSMTPLYQNGATYTITVQFGEDADNNVYSFMFTAPGPTDVVSGGVVTMDLHTTYVPKK